MPQTLFGTQECSRQAPLPLTAAGLEQIRRYGTEPFIEQCREAFGPQSEGRGIRISPFWNPAEPPQVLNLFPLGEEAFFLCRSAPALDPERCYIKARKAGRVYYLEENQAPAALGGDYEILYYMLGKELAELMDGTEGKRGL